MKRKFVFPLYLTAVVLLIGSAGLLIPGCGSKKKEFIDLGTAPAGGVFNPVGNAIAETLNDNAGDNNWKVTGKGTKGSQENIRKLQTGELQLGMSNAAISYFAFKGEGDWDKEYSIRTIATLAPNIAMFVTTDRAISSISDLKGKKVYVGPDGAGFKMFLEPILKAHGVNWDDLDHKYGSQNAAVDMMTDGQVDAAFLGGAVPASSVQRACNELDVYFIPFADDAKKKLSEEFEFFWPATIPEQAYGDLKGKGDYNGLNVGSMHLITSAKIDEETIYQITKTIWNNRKSIGHPAAEKSLVERNVIRDTGTPFHPGAIRFYKEIDIWPEE